MIENVWLKLSPGTFRRLRQESANSRLSFSEFIETLILEALKARDAQHLAGYIQ